MPYEIILNKAKIIQTNGKIVVPLTYTGKTNFIIPDTIVNFCINHYGLANSHIQVLDPMCGIGTIPRIINESGGNCIGIEIDENRFGMALEVSNNKEKLIRGDCLDVALAANSFQCIFTSMPFDWFKQNDNQMPLSYAEKFKELLTDDGFILLDSLPMVNRAGQTWSVASRQCEYLEKNGFSLVEITRFRNDALSDSINESVIMKFIPLLHCAKN